MATFKYASTNEAPVYQSVVNGKGKKIINRILLGTYVQINEKQGDFYQVATAGPDGWMNKKDLSDSMYFKVFFLDVGQGDGILIEAGGLNDNKRLKILIDAGLKDNMLNYLTKWQYSYVKPEEKVHFDYVFISHFDADHFTGLIKIFENPKFTFGKIYHPGILKFASSQQAYNTILGNTLQINGVQMLNTFFNDLSVENSTEELNQGISALVKAVKKARSEGRLNEVSRIEAGAVPIQQKIEGVDLKAEVLAPFTEINGGQPTCVYFGDDGKTINGHSLVVKFTFGKRTFLFGGDLNADSETYISNKYTADNPFEVDVAKACHHGSSDFTTSFMAKVNPYATVISSGDNEAYAHPRADAIGCAGRYSRGDRPLVFSTELARSVDLRTKKILYGLINLRSDGKDIFISQMKEKHTGGNVWDSYKI
jgi:beta-lactamase superfamily II metal-dependent hydrolase